MSLLSMLSYFRPVMYWTVFLLALVCTPALAQPTARETAPAEAAQVVDRISQRILKAADNYTSAKKDPEQFFLEVEELLDEVVDFHIFARGVMGSYVSRSAMAALPVAARKEREQQIERFATAFRNSLVRAYGNAFLSLQGKIQVEIVGSTKKSNRTEDVEQKISGATEQPATVRYRMMRDGESWRLHNIAIEKINLGKLYRSQFHALAKKYDGDLNRVIDGWVSTAEKDTVKEQQQEKKVTAKSQESRKTSEKKNVAKSKADAKPAVPAKEKP